MFARIENEIAILKRHLRVLEAVDEHGPVGLVTLSNRLPYPRHKIRYSLRVLESEDLVKSTECGVTTTDQVTDFWPTVDRTVEAVQHTLDQLRSDEHPTPSGAARTLATD